MDRMKLMRDLDAAVKVVETKKAALAEAQTASATAIEQARINVQAAAAAHGEALETAKDLRRALEADLNIALPGNPAGVQVNG